MDNAESPVVVSSHGDDHIESGRQPPGCSSSSSRNDDKIIDDSAATIRIKLKHIKTIRITGCGPTDVVIVMRNNTGCPYDERQKFKQLQNSEPIDQHHQEDPLDSSAQLAEPEEYDDDEDYGEDYDEEFDEEEEEVVGGQLDDGKQQRDEGDDVAASQNENVTQDDSNYSSMKMLKNAYVHTRIGLTNLSSRIIGRQRAAMRFLKRFTTKSLGKTAEPSLSPSDKKLRENLRLYETIVRGLRQNERRQMSYCRGRYLHSSSSSPSSLMYRRRYSV